MENLFVALATLIGTITGILGIIFWGCLVFMAIQCVQYNLIPTLVRYLENKR